MLNWALVESASARSKNANVLKNAVGLGSANVLKNAAGLMSVTASKNGAGLKSVLSKGSEAAEQSLSGARLNTASELLEFDAVIDEGARTPGVENRANVGPRVASPSEIRGSVGDVRH